MKERWEYNREQLMSFAGKARLAAAGVVMLFSGWVIMGLIGWLVTADGKSGEKRRLYIYFEDAEVENVLFQ